VWKPSRHTHATTQPTLKAPLTKWTLRICHLTSNTKERKKKRTQHTKRRWKHG